MASSPCDIHFHLSQIDNELRERLVSLMVARTVHIARLMVLLFPILCSCFRVSFFHVIYDHRKLTILHKKVTTLSNLTRIDSQEYSSLYK